MHVGSDFFVLRSYVEINVLGAALEIFQPENKKNLLGYTCK